MSKFEKIIAGIAGLACFVFILSFLFPGQGNLGGLVHTLQEDFTQGIRVAGSEVVNSSGSWVGAVSGTSGSFSSDVAIAGGLSYDEEVTAITATTTLSGTQSGQTFYIGNGTPVITLPAVASSSGVVYRFVISEAISSNATITSAEGDNLEGALIVAGAVVTCDAGDVLTFVADGENLGDFVEIRSNGSKWYVTQSNVLTASKLTCSG